MRDIRIEIDYFKHAREGYSPLIPDAMVTNIKSRRA